MKVYNRKNDLKWSKRVKWPKAIILFVILITILFLLFFFVIGGKTLLLRAILTSLVISGLITFGYIYTSVLNYEEVTPVIKDKELYLIIKQREKDFYDTDVKRKVDIDYSNEKELSKILSKDNKNIGLAVLKVSKYDIIKEGKDIYYIRVEGSINKWSFYEKKKQFGYELVEKEDKRVIKIDSSYNNYKELIKFIKKGE